MAYLKERNQFGRPVGSFQAFKHRLADVWQELVTARAAARYAADALASDSDDVRGRRLGRRRRTARWSPCTRPRRPSSCTAASA